jgi:2-polyprenyl-6-hydroxyphenyl methylase/3-demethylubiquinone-9 3-methyltransferase
MRSRFDRFVRGQQRWSRRFDALLPAEYQVDGNRDFVENWIAPRLRPGAVVYDIGGGKNPAIPVSEKRRLGLRVTGIDIDAGELARAPEGAYDEAIAADITAYRGRGDGDLIVCQALLEHVPDTRAAMQAIAGILKPGGTALLFLPSRNAVFARINLLLPEAVKRKALFTVFPSTERDQGFPAYYNRCTPAEFRKMAGECGLAVDVCKPYFRSSYFTFLFPLHLAWRAWIALFRMVRREQAAETFSLALRKL